MISACFALLKRSTVPTRYPVMRRISSNFTLSPAFPPSTRNPFHVLPEKHPHMRGEDVFRTIPPSTILETPPRAWGRLSRTNKITYSSGNTPTCVGKTNAWSYKDTVFEKHPHVRGEDSGPCNALELHMETPPRAWGRPDRLERYNILTRNTPTCVGKTRPQDRARVAGETPPRAWGRL